MPILEGASALPALRRCCGLSGSDTKGLSVGRKPDTWFDQQDGNRLTRTHLVNAATVMLSGTGTFSSLKDWGIRLGKKIGLHKARIAVARKLRSSCSISGVTAPTSSSRPMPSFPTVR